ncbi:hypothetical protein GCM10009536_65290 [Streptomyces thermocarboxydus]
MDIGDSCLGYCKHKYKKDPWPQLNAGDQGSFQRLFGGVLLSHRVPPAVPSAL